jgi:hypothetical protein
MQEGIELKLKFLEKLVLEFLKSQKKLQQWIGHVKERMEH